MSDEISKGPKQDTDWFSSNGTISNVSNAVNLASGLKSDNALDRIVSIAKIIAAFYGKSG